MFNSSVSSLRLSFSLLQYSDQNNFASITVGWRKWSPIRRAKTSRALSFASLSTLVYLIDRTRIRAWNSLIEDHRTRLLVLARSATLSFSLTGQVRTGPKIKNLDYPTGQGTGQQDSPILMTGSVWRWLQLWNWIDNSIRQQTAITGDGQKCSPSDGEACNWQLIVSLISEGGRSNRVMSQTQVTLCLLGWKGVELTYFSFPWIEVTPMHSLFYSIWQMHRFQWKPIAFLLLVDDNFSSSPLVTAAVASCGFSETIHLTTRCAFISIGNEYQPCTFGSCTGK